MQLLTYSGGKPLFIALQESIPATGDDSKTVPTSYVQYLANLGFLHSVAAFQHGVDYELEHAQQSHMVFRTNGFSSRVLMETLRLYGANYLKHISDPILDMVLPWTELDARSHEVNRFRVEERDLQGRTMEEFVSEARAKLIALSERLLSSILDTPVPEAIKALLREAKLRFEAKWPDAKYPVTGSLLILRLIIPYIAGVQGLIPETQRVLLRCLQMIQCISNGSHMKGEDDAFANEWIDAKHSQFATFLSSASTTPLSAEQIATAIASIDTPFTAPEPLLNFLQAHPEIETKVLQK